jgi:hypothetical protein
LVALARRAVAQATRCTETPYGARLHLPRVATDEVSVAIRRWRPQGDSNPRYRRERAMSWASRRWGRRKIGGARRDRTVDLLHAMQALSQLSYGPTRGAGKYAPLVAMSSAGSSRALSQFQRQIKCEVHRFVTGSLTGISRLSARGDSLKYVRSAVVLASQAYWQTRREAGTQSFRSGVT